MTKKDRRNMSFQDSAKASDDADRGEEKCRTPQESKKTLGSETKCGLFPDRVVRAKEELPNPRKLKHLTIGEAIDRRDRDAVVVVQALMDSGFTHVYDLLDKYPNQIFGDLDVTEQQLRAFLTSIESAGVRFTPSKVD